MASSFVSNSSDSVTPHSQSPHSNLILQSISLAKIAHSLQKEAERAGSDDFAQRLAEQAEATLIISRNLLRLGATLVVEESRASQTQEVSGDEGLPVLEHSPLDLGEPLVVDERYNITARAPRLARVRWPSEVYRTLP